MADRVLIEVEHLTRTKVIPKMDTDIVIFCTEVTTISFVPQDIAIFFNLKQIRKPFTISVEHQMTFLSQHFTGWNLLQSNSTDRIGLIYYEIQEIKFTNDKRAHTTSLRQTRLHNFKLLAH